MRNYFSTVLAVALISSVATASDLSDLTKECAKIGYKLKSPKNSDCALKLRSIEQWGLALALKAKQEEDEKKYLADLYREQQEKNRELERRSVEAQESIARSQNREVFNNILFNGVQMMNRSGAYAPSYNQQPRTPVTCITMPHGIISCN